MSWFKLIEGDCLKVSDEIADSSVDAIICDLPYGTTACAWDSVIPFAPMWECIKRVVKPGGAVVMFGAQPFTSALIMSNVEWFKQEIIWDKISPTGHLNARRYMMPQHENIILFCDGTPVYNPQGTKSVTVKNSRVQKSKPGGVYGKVNSDTYVTTEGNFPTTILPMCRMTHGQVHSTQKPVDLLLYLIKTYTNPGATIVDLTMGSGSTIVAAIECGRNGIGIEKDANYFQVASERIESAQRRMNGLARKVIDRNEDLPLFASA